MRWYFSRNGETVGPLEESALVDQVRAGVHAGMVRDEAGGPWTPIEHSPFGHFISAARAQATAGDLAKKKRAPAMGRFGGRIRRRLIRHRDVAC